MRIIIVHKSAAEQALVCVHGERRAQVACAQQPQRAGHAPIRMDEVNSLAGTCGTNMAIKLGKRIQVVAMFEPNTK